MKLAVFPTGTASTVSAFSNGTARELLLRRDQDSENTINDEFKGRVSGQPLRIEVPTPAVNLPTNMWWSNLVHGQGKGEGNGVNVSPYLVSVVAEPGRIGANVHMPFTFIKTDPKTPGVHSYIDSFYPRASAWFVGFEVAPLKEMTGSGGDSKRFARPEVSHFVSDFDDLSVTKVISYKRESRGDSRPHVTKLYLVRGSPLVTLELPEQPLMLAPLDWDRELKFPNYITRFTVLPASSEAMQSAKANASTTYDCPDEEVGRQNKSLPSDTFVLQLLDGSEWVLIVSEPLALRCLTKRDKAGIIQKNWIESAEPLPEGTIVRLGVGNVCNMTAVTSDTPTLLEHTKRLCDHQYASTTSALLSHSHRYYPVSASVDIGLQPVSNASSNPKGPSHARISYRFCVRRMQRAMMQEHQSYNEKMTVFVNGLHQKLLPQEMPRAFEGPSACLETAHGPLCMTNIDVSPSRSSDGICTYEAVLRLAPISLSSASFHESPEVPDDWQQLLADQIWSDLNGSEFRLPAALRRGDYDAYRFGRILHKYAHTALVAHRIKAPLLRDEALHRIRGPLEKWLSFTSGNRLVTDDLWGGVVPCGCDADTKGNPCHYRFNKRDGVVASESCVSLYEPERDAGSGLYANHLAIYGYLVYVAAVLTYFDRSWPKKRIGHPSMRGDMRFHDAVMLLIRDVADVGQLIGDRPSRNLTRYKDWWWLNSWNSGIGEDPEGPSATHTTEIVFSYYAISLYAEVTKKKGMYLWARFLSMTEMLFARTFMHLHAPSSSPSSSPVFPSPVRIYPEKMTNSLPFIGRFAEMAVRLEEQPSHLYPLSPVALELFGYVADRIERKCDGCAGFQQGWGVGTVAGQLLLKRTRSGEARRLLKTEMRDTCFDEGLSGCEAYLPGQINSSASLRLANSTWSSCSFDWPDFPATNIAR
ncbi:unnamed protein product [Vitrella brassicaformis CCMP3155]|uniref:glucan endo-1,3-beta-D-glucosidase n=2 Tax=Vitrella brassicaformis TaxID=1169539 RepID=A0A0G4GLY6_VITBC|nr:unnamed protein product [Vitrella brassicaformis CCMP3155]|eukprot:CEM31131.1 unnamed protein product [Vitrella brassicaformis CCMP3155]